ncbi:MAG: nuclear transport factor 2 family protein [Candidatus Cloacimonetes bacterium]|nr:nuclear transport factor 2 family protein [Candidatus Cloacimonadota bacterium]
MRESILPLFLSICCLLACNKVSSPGEANAAEINQLLNDLELAFNYHDLDEIMTFYHEDFLHNGNDFDAETVIWDNRLLDYLELEIDNITVDVISGEYAVASFTMTLSNQDGFVTSQEPSQENGDLSYLQLFFSDWKIVGNQQE